MTIELDEAKYLAELKKIIKPKSFLDIADLMPYCEDLVSSIFLKDDFLYYNDNVPRFSLETTKASLIYKMMFDFSNESAFIFADGFHKEAFDKYYVIESFRNFVFRVFDQNKVKNDKTIPLILVSKGRFENVDRNLRSSDFFKEVMLLQNATSEGNSVCSLSHYDLDTKLDSFLEVESVLDNNVEIGIKINKRTADEENTRIVYNMNSFSVFDKAYYRIEQNNIDGRAYVNFGDSEGANILTNFFNLLKDKADKKDFSLTHPALKDNNNE